MGNGLVFALLSGLSARCFVLPKEGAMTISQTSSFWPQRFAAGFLAVLFVAALTACGGGGGGGGSTSYSGKSTAATIDGNNADDLADAATQASIAAIIQDAPPDASVAVSLSAGRVTMSDDLRQRLDAIHQQVIDQAGGLAETASAADFSIPGDCGGSASYSVSDNKTVLKYKNWCVSDEESGNIIINGVVTVTATETSSTTHYENFTIENTFTGEVERIDNMTITCNQVGEVYTCSITSDFVGTNGIIYRVENVNVTDNGINFDVAARVYDPTHGYVDFVAEGLVRDCPDGGFSAGTITVSSSDSAFEIIVVFSGCGMVNVSLSELPL